MQQIGKERIAMIAEARRPRPLVPRTKGVSYSIARRKYSGAANSTIRIRNRNPEPAIAGASRHPVQRPVACPVGGVAS